MSQILLISDTHFLKKQELLHFINQFDNISNIIHCGDIYLGYKPGDIPHMYICKGNNDFADIPSIAHFTIDGVSFVITHGHKHYFSYKPLTLKNLLYDYPADIICFGHTHVPYYYEDKDVKIVNPGSLTLSRTYPKLNTYAIIDTTTRQITFYDMKTHQEIHIEKETHS